MTLQGSRTCSKGAPDWPQLPLGLSPPLRHCSSTGLAERTCVAKCHILGRERNSSARRDRRALRRRHTQRAVVAAALGEDGARVVSGSPVVGAEGGPAQQPTACLWRGWLCKRKTNHLARRDCRQPALRPNAERAARARRDKLFCDSRRGGVACSPPKKLRRAGRPCDREEECRQRALCSEAVGGRAHSTHGGN